MTITYDQIGRTYIAHRATDPRISAAINAALGNAQTVLNVGAGTGSYEPSDRAVVAVEPSQVMIAQRGVGRAPAIRAVAESLPFADKSFDAITGVLTLHHWTDRQCGLAECARVARNTIVLLTWDPHCDDFWLVRDYFPSLLQQDRKRFSTIDEFSRTFDNCKILPLPIPADCADGFLGAYWQRPEAYLDENVRTGISSFARAADLQSGLDQLRRDLESGAWHRKHADLLQRDSLDLGYRLVIARL